MDIKLIIIIVLVLVIIGILLIKSPKEKLKKYLPWIISLGAIILTYLSNKKSDDTDDKIKTFNDRIEKLEEKNDDLAARIEEDKFEAQRLEEVRDQLNANTTEREKEIEDRFEKLNSESAFTDEESANNYLLNIISQQQSKDSKTE